ncbi:hypothetical protein ANCCEY_08166 [Ancylostoma ceylanicum]|uniref:Uncharacterized protein n=1 Tax=Ancylostoma ceylanicum TaxID=53326 RepID=A0A0D6LL58_9BILA|nr:hypothetical protein ANCCEY_08166 [Ancylostoma ceylanicum]
MAIELVQPVGTLPSVFFRPFIRAEPVMEVSQTQCLRVFGSESDFHPRPLAYQAIHPITLMILRNTTIVLIVVVSNLHAEFCGNNRIPFGIEVIVRRGEFFEAEERYDKNDEDVIHFDMITNIRRKVDDRGEYYSLTVHRYFCGKIPDTPPDWYLKKNWPFWPEMEAQHVS